MEAGTSSSLSSDDLFNLASFAPFYPNIYLLPPTLKHLANRLIFHNTANLTQTKSSLESPHKFLTIFRGLEESFYRLYAKETSYLIGTAKIFRIKDCIFSVHIDLLKSPDTETQQLWLAYINIQEMSTIYGLWTLSPEEYPIKMRNIDKAISESPVILALVEHLKTFKKEEVTNGFSLMKATSETRALFPEHTHIYKCKRCSNFLEIGTESSHTCYQGITIVEQCEYKQLSEESFKCFKCGKIIPKILLNNHAFVHRRGRKANTNYTEEAVQGNKRSVKNSISIPIRLGDSANAMNFSDIHLPEKRSHDDSILVSDDNSICSSLN